MIVSTQKFNFRMRLGSEVQLAQLYSKFGEKMLSLRDSEKSREEVKEELKKHYDDLHNQLETILHRYRI